jgi:hypothetical protein
MALWIAGWSYPVIKMTSSVQTRLDECVGQMVLLLEGVEGVGETPMAAGLWLFEYHPPISDDCYMHQSGKRRCIQFRCLSPCRERLMGTCLHDSLLGRWPFTIIMACINGMTQCLCLNCSRACPSKTRYLHSLLASGLLNACLLQSGVGRWYFCSPY